MKRWVVLAAVLMLAIAVHAEVYTLNADGTGDFANIQAAINACVDGDVIQLEDGTYTGTGNRNIDFISKTITLCGISGNAEDCVIDIQGVHGNYVSERGLMLESGEGPETTIRDLSIINGDGDGS